jgi:hypothetical protein
MRKGCRRLMPTTAALTLAAVLWHAAPALSAAVTDLPEPVLSRAIDAVLMPIDANARSYFELAEDDSGALVLAVAPGGVAELYGIMPGDMIVTVSDLSFAWPDEIDPIVWAFLNDRKFDFVWAISRNGADVTISFPLVLSHFQESYLVGDIPGWASWQGWSRHSSQGWSAYATRHIRALDENFAGPPVCGSCIAPEVADSDAASDSGTPVDAAADAAGDTASVPAVAYAPHRPVAPASEQAAPEEPASEPAAAVSVEATEDEGAPASTPAALRGSMVSEPEPARIPQPAPPRPSGITANAPVDAVPVSPSASAEGAAVIPDAAIPGAESATIIVPAAPLLDGNATAVGSESPVAETTGGVQYYVLDGDDFDDGMATDAAGTGEPDFCTRFPATCRLREQGYGSNGGGGPAGWGGGGGGGDAN